MEILSILHTVLLGIMLWDMHRGVKEIKGGMEGIAAIAKDVSDKTDELLRRVPPTA